MRWDGYERRRNGGLSDEQFEAIAERSAEIVRDSIYKEIGKTIVTRALLVLGTIVCAALLYYAQVKFGFRIVGVGEK